MILITTIDFHIHGKLKSSYCFEKSQFIKIIKEAQKEGINCLALTEHLHSQKFLEGYNFLNDNYLLCDDYYEAGSFKIFYGMEITTDQRLDVLLIGNPKMIIKFRDKITKDLGPYKDININSLFKNKELSKFLVILAHPFRRHESFPNLSKEVISKIDAIEFNATDLCKYGINKMKNKIIKLSKELDKPIVGGSDTHYFFQSGSLKNIFKEDCYTIKEFKTEIKNNMYEVIFSKSLIFRVKVAKIMKKLIVNIKKLKKQIF